MAVLRDALSLGTQATLSSMRVTNSMHHSVTGSLGFFRDPLRADGSPAATLVHLGPCWCLHLERVKEIIFYCFYKCTRGSSPQDNGTSVTSWGETILGWGWGWGWECTAQPFTLALVGCFSSSEENCWYPHSQSTSTQSQASMSPSSMEQAGDRRNSRLPSHWKQDHLFLQSTPIT